MAVNSLASPARASLSRCPAAKWSAPSCCSCSMLPLFADAEPYPKPQSPIVRCAAGPCSSGRRSRRGRVAQATRYGLQQIVAAGLLDERVAELEDLARSGVGDGVEVARPARFVDARPAGGVVAFLAECAGDALANSKPEGPSVAFPDCHRFSLVRTQRPHGRFSPCEAWQLLCHGSSGCRPRHRRHSVNCN